jgi:hypothetical protein
MIGTLNTPVKPSPAYVASRLWELPTDPGAQIEPLEPLLWQFLDRPAREHVRGSLADGSRAHQYLSQTDQPGRLAFRDVWPGEPQLVTSSTAVVRSFIPGAQ